MEQGGRRKAKPRFFLVISDDESEVTAKQEAMYIPLVTKAEVVDLTGDGESEGTAQQENKYTPPVTKEEVVDPIEEAKEENPSPDVPEPKPHVSIPPPAQCEAPTQSSTEPTTYENTESDPGSDADLKPAPTVAHLFEQEALTTTAPPSPPHTSEGIIKHEATSPPTQTNTQADTETRTSADTPRNLEQNGSESPAPPTPSTPTTTNQATNSTDNTQTTTVKTEPLPSSPQPTNQTRSVRRQANEQPAPSLPNQNAPPRDPIPDIKPPEIKNEIPSPVPDIKPMIRPRRFFFNQKITSSGMSIEQVEGSYPRLATYLKGMREGLPSVVLAKTDPQYFHADHAHTFPDGENNQDYPEAAQGFPVGGVHMEIIPGDIVIRWCNDSDIEVKAFRVEKVENIREKARETIGPEDHYCLLATGTPIKELNEGDGYEKLRKILCDRMVKKGRLSSIFPGQAGQSGDEPESIDEGEESDGESEDNGVTTRSSWKRKSTEKTAAKKAKKQKKGGEGNDADSEMGKENLYKKQTYRNPRFLHRYDADAVMALVEEMNGIKYCKPEPPEDERA